MTKETFQMTLWLLMALSATLSFTLVIFLEVTAKTGVTHQKNTTSTFHVQPRSGFFGRCPQSCVCTGQLPIGNGNYWPTPAVPR
jgi:hypothetical protein